MGDGYAFCSNLHCLENPGLTDLVMIEVQSGEYLGEDDIVRLDDVYRCAWQYNKFAAVLGVSA